MKESKTSRDAANEGIKDQQGFSKRSNQGPAGMQPKNEPRNSRDAAKKGIKFQQGKYYRYFFLPVGLQAV